MHDPCNYGVDKCKIVHKLCINVNEGTGTETTVLAPEVARKSEGHLPGASSMIAEADYEINVMVMNASPKPGLKKIVQDRDDRGVCLLCEEPAAKRGLCTKHHGRMHAARARVPRRLRLAWEAEQIKEGRLLPSREGVSRDFRNEFES